MTPPDPAGDVRRLDRAVIAALNTSHASGHSESETDRAHRSRDGFNALREQAFALLQ